MKSLDSRDKLIENISSYITGISPENKKKLQEEIRHDDKITIGQLFQLFTGRGELQDFSDAQLYWLISAISSVSKKAGKPEDYFEDAEIKSHRFYEKINENEVTRPIVFKEAVKLADNQYMFPCSIEEIKKLKAANVLQIVPELQRNTTKNKYDELKTKVNQKTAQQIADLIDEGKFFFNGIRFNLMNDGDSDEPVFDQENHTLTVYDGTIIVPDGNHRTIGCELAKRHLDDKFCVLFTFLSVSDTRSLLNQEWTTVPIPKKHKEAMKQTFSNEIVDGIIRSDQSDTIYSKQIVKDGTEIRVGHGFILYSDLADAINLYYDANKQRPKVERDEIRDWLISYMNYLSGILFDDFKDYKKIRKEKWSVLPSTWYFYIMISKVLRGSENWKQELKTVIGMYDFSNKKIREIFATNHKRSIVLFCREQEENICTTLNKNSNS